MTLGLKITFAVLVLAAAGLVFAVWLASARWNSRTFQLVEKLKRPVPPGGAKTVLFKDFELLPAPVARYFRLALKEGQPLIRSARMVQVGEFRSRKAGEGWSPFEAKQTFSAHPPGFVWDASIRMAPWVRVRVRDAYVAGQGSMQGRVLSLLPVVDERGRAELNAGALHRYLAESVWFPTALLPSEGVKWSSLDNSRALATLTDLGTTVFLEFRFNDAGEITRVFTPGRYREVKGNYRLTPWAGHFASYQERKGLWIPVEGRVEWQLPGGIFVYWKGRILEIEYDFAR